MNKKQNKHHIFTILTVALLISSCTDNTKNHEMLSLKYDSMVVAHENTLNTISSLEEVVIIIDSIELGYEELNFDLEVGTDYTNYASKMDGIASYVAKAEARITELEAKLGNDVSFIENIRKELTLKTQKIRELEMAVEDLKDKNNKLFDLVMVQGQTIHNKATELLLKQQEIALIEAHVEELLKQAEVNEANAFYARAEAIEEAANRTQLAPRKKKETLNRALFFYEQSLEKGNDAAKDKIAELKNRLN